MFSSLSETSSPNHDRKMRARKPVTVNDHDSSIVDFQTVLRIRPLLKKEREDPIILEPLTTDSTSVVLHPMAQKHPDILSPSDMLVRQTLSPEAVKTEVDEEFTFDHVWSEDDDQEKIYFSLGLPMALAAMEPLKVDSHASNVPRKNNLIITMGNGGSGKSHTCWGSHINAKRKSEDDGLAPRIIDSLFSQSKHHLVNKRHYSFAVNISMTQVNQKKNKPDCDLHDLLQPVATRTFSIASTASSLTFSSNGSNRSPIISNLQKVERAAPLSKRTCSTSTQYSSLDEPVFLEQDSVSSDIRLINAQVRTCRNTEEARDALQTGMKNSARLSGKKVQEYVMVTLQPVVLDRSGKIVREGGAIAILDMAGSDASCSTRSNRIKDSLPNCNDPHAAVLHCLRTLHANEDIRAGKTPKSLEERVDVSSGDGSHFGKHHKSFRKVPYRQHKLCMLLQPLFSFKNSDNTLVTLLTTVYPGHRDYNEKKTLMNDVIHFHNGSVAKVSTGVCLPTTSSARKERRSRRKEVPSHIMSSDADDEAEPKVAPMKVPTEYVRCDPVAVAPGRYNAATYSDSSLDDEFSREPLPPPVAPRYFQPPVSVLSPEATAPYEEEDPQIPDLPSLARRYVAPTDFPGVQLPPSSSLSLSSDESAPPSPPKHVHDVPVATAVLVEGNMAAFQEDEFEESVSMQATATRVFSPMKTTFNKVVHASKKKGKQVMEKMGNLSLEKGCDDNSFVMARLKTLQIDNDRLTAETKMLREENDELQKENDELKRSLRRYETADLHSHSYDDDDQADRKQPDMKPPCEIHDEDGSVSEADGCETGRTHQNGGLLDDSIFQHLASMGGYGNGTESAWSPAPPSSSLQPFSLKYPRS